MYNNILYINLIHSLFNPHLYKTHCIVTFKSNLLERFTDRTYYVLAEIFILVFEFLSLDSIQMTSQMAANYKN